MAINWRNVAVQSLVGCVVGTVVGLAVACREIDDRRIKWFVAGYNAAVQDLEHGQPLKYRLP